MKLIVPCRLGFLVGSLTLSANLLSSACVAWAGIGFGAAPTVPSSLVVGDTNVPANLTMVNASNGRNATQTLTIDIITFVPSCGAPPSTGTSDCATSALDPGVLRPSATGTGRVATGCAGTTFTINLVDAAQGKYQFNPASPALIGPAGGPTGTCVIDFTLDVLKAPTKDADATQPGTQTLNFAFVRGGTPDGQAVATGSGIATIAPFVGGDPTTTSLATTARRTIGAGGPLAEAFSDEAKLERPSANAAMPTGTVTFELFGPNDTDCSHKPIFTSNPRPLTAGIAASGDFEPSGNGPTGVAGQYRFVATYTGDANYRSVTSACSDPNESVATTPCPPPLPLPIRAGVATGRGRFGLSDQSGLNDGQPTFTDPLAAALKVSRVRLTVPFDLVQQARKSRTRNARGCQDYLRTRRWIEDALQGSREPLISFEHSSVAEFKRLPGRLPGRMIPNLPSVAEYVTDVQAFMKQFPAVAVYTAWNEPNDKSQPTLRAAARAAHYFSRLSGLCQRRRPRCTVAAGDFIDNAWLQAWYMPRYYAALGKTHPRIWAYHPYRYIEDRESGKGDARLQAFLHYNNNLRHSQIWFTEAGAFAREHRDPHRLHPEEHNLLVTQATDLAKFLHKLDSMRRVTRFYYFEWHGDSGTHLFDTGLIGAEMVDPAGINVPISGGPYSMPRPVYCAYHARTSPGRPCPTRAGP